MITRLRLENFKCFDNLDLELPRFGCFIGPNNSGKSTIFEALSLLRASFFGAPEEVFVGFNEPTYLRSISASANVRVVLSVTNDGGFAYERTMVPTGHVGTAHFSESYQGAGNSAPDGIPLVADFSLLFDGLAVYRFDPSAIAKPCPVSTAKTGRLAVSGAGLAAALMKLKIGHGAAFSQIQRDLATSFGEIEEIVLELSASPTCIERSGNDLPGGPWVHLGFRLEGGSTVPAAHSSAGVLLYLACLYLQRCGEPLQVLLVEEPENGNHPRRIGEILGVLRRIANPSAGHGAVQVLMTTHSPFVLDHLSEEEVFVVTRDEALGTSTIRPMTDVTYLKERRADFSLGELWYNVGEDDMFAAPEPKSKRRQKKP
jgi:hypothetical protein